MYVWIHLKNKQIVYNKYEKRLNDIIQFYRAQSSNDV